jgi:2-dehydro-3-deoxyphosphogluconate aldolase/(4S)-4-hydroxy-2-oxoglutarate aldolase
MSVDITKLIEKQKTIPIIGKGNSSEIINKFNRLVLDKYNVIEITLRSDEALETAIRLKDQNPNINIGLGSIKSLPMLEKVFELNFDFYISPGINQKMLEFSKKNNILFIPGVSTCSEILTAIEFNFKLLKYFHAEKNGGPNSLKFLDEIFNEISFIPTGGIHRENMDSYFAIDNVIAVGSTSF